jgi:tRNA A37 threonylcarbamoyladenosine dehydratase
MDERFSRSARIFGVENQEKLNNTKVLVFGLGGVGGAVCEVLARSGVGTLGLVDKDVVDITNINRQLIALHSTIGRPKSEVLAERLRDINPELDLIIIKEYLEAEKAGEVLGEYKIDFLVDAIDTLSPKLHLIKYCMDNGIPLVSSMGAGAKYDATKVRITDVSKSFNCPLAYIVRKRLRYMGIKKGFKVVFSEELPDKESIIPCEDRNKKSQVGTISYIPAVFGCVCAQAAVQHLITSACPDEPDREI